MRTISGKEKGCTGFSLNRRNTRKLIVELLEDGRSRSQREIASELGLDLCLINAALFRAWESGAILRSDKPFYESKGFPRGKYGLKIATRGYYKYCLPDSESDNFLSRDGLTFVRFSRDYFDPRSKRSKDGKSKSRIIIDYLKDNSGKAFFTRDLREKLKDKGIRACDIMAAGRRYQRKGLVLVRGYNTDNNLTPFRQGFLLTWIDQDKILEKAVSEAYERTDAVLSRSDNATPSALRIHMVRSLVIEAARSKEILNPSFLQRQIKCTDDEIETALRRCVQLYPDVKEVKLFNAYRYYYHSSLSPEELHATVEMKKNYVRQNKGKDARIGHNWEAACEFFIDKFTLGANFWTQSHRVKMDPRRITLHLMKPVGNRHNNAEVDRVWEVSPGPFSPPTTYVLECKWGLIMKKYIDDFFDVLRWSTDFGADSSAGRAIKQGVIGIFAGSSFNPNEIITLKDGTKLSVPQYAARNNITICKAVDFNKKLQEHSVAKEFTVQKICRIGRDEKDVKRILDSIWSKPESASEVLGESLDQNKSVFELESLMEVENDSTSALESEELVTTNSDSNAIPKSSLLETKDSIR